MSIEQRISPRKILRVKAQLILEDRTVHAARTIDISASGLAITVPNAVSAKQLGHISFDMFVEGKLHKIATTATIAHGVLSNSEYRLGLQFVKLDLSALTAVTKYVAAQ